MPKKNGRNSVYPNMEGEIKLSIDETRLEELREWHDAETNDPETQDWRDDLTPDEMAVVAKWDRQYALGIGKLAQAIIAQQHMNKLPETCLSVLPGSGELIVIKRGESGYYHSNWNTPNPVENREIADFHNRKRGITHAQEEAMLVGSMAGWDVPGADPDSYEEKQQEKSIQDELPYKLPATCMSVSQSSGELIIIERGTSGYVCSRRNTNDIIPYRPGTAGRHRARRSAVQFPVRQIRRQICVFSPDSQSAGAGHGKRFISSSGPRRQTQRTHAASPPQPSSVALCPPPFRTKQELAPTRQRTDRETE